MAGTDLIGPFRADVFAGSAGLVTGGGTGIGRAIALTLAAGGARVVVTGRRPEPLADVVEEISQMGGRAWWATCDVRDPDSVDRIVGEAGERLGTIDLLVNNAGATFTAPAISLSPGGFRAVVETDAFGTFYMCQAVAKQLVDQGLSGAMLNVTSISSITGNPGRVHGGVGKAGVDSLTKSLAVEWGRHQIRVNSLAPGYTPTAGVDRATDVRSQEDIERRAAGVPLGRVAALNDIAWAAAFLLSPAASFISGATLVVDGAKWLASGRTYDADAGVQS